LSAVELDIVNMITPCSRNQPILGQGMSTFSLLKKILIAFQNKIARYTDFSTSRVPVPDETSFY
jgi:hypothetical protein